MSKHSKLLLAPCALALFGLSSCGGGGGMAFNQPPPTPTPTPTPTPVPTPSDHPPIVAAATTSQQFATMGASYNSPSSSYDKLVVSAVDLADNAQLDVRYDGGTKSYEVRLPTGGSWRALTPITNWDGETYSYTTGGTDSVDVIDYGANLQYSGLTSWAAHTSSGFSAIGIATLPGDVPTTGSASYYAWILGGSSETFFSSQVGAWYAGATEGNMNLNFDFASGQLSGNINPTLYLDQAYVLPSLTFADTVYSTGSTNFSGQFATPLSGLNSFAGLFTGPNGEELIGNFAFPYVSPIDGATQQAGGAFAGRKN